MVLTSILIGPVDEEVHGSHLGDLLLLAVQPQDLLTAAFQRLVLHGDGGAVVPAGVSQSCRITDAGTHKPAFINAPQT